MLGVRLLPQILCDLNFFNVNSEKELASRLRAVQQVAAAAIGAYLYVRYEPILVARLGGTSISVFAVTFAFSMSYWCLSSPSTCLSLGGVSGHQRLFAAFRDYKDKKFIQLAINVGWFFAFYVLGQKYKAFENDSPDLLERFFQKVEDKLTKPLWDRFYKKEG